jgi:hypothetical protein
LLMASMAVSSPWISPPAQWAIKESGVRFTAGSPWR